MFKRKVVQEALKRIWANDGTVSNPRIPPVGLNILTSLLIHDIFGGEILKTHKKKGWHYYNLIDGKRVDFTISEMGNRSAKSHFEDIATTPDETNVYLAQEDYSIFYMRFIMAFEEAIGLGKYQSGYTT